MLATARATIAGSAIDAMHQDRSGLTPVNAMIKALTGLLMGLVGVVYALLGGVAALAIVGFVFAFLVA